MGAWARWSAALSWALEQGPASAAAQLWPARRACPRHSREGGDCHSNAPPGLGPGSPQHHHHHWPQRALWPVQCGTLVKNLSPAWLCSAEKQPATLSLPCSLGLLGGSDWLNLNHTQNQSQKGTADTGCGFLAPTRQKELGQVPVPPQQTTLPTSGPERTTPRDLDEPGTFRSGRVSWEARDVRNHPVT